MERDPAETFKALPVDGWKNCKKEEIDHLRGKIQGVEIKIGVSNVQGDTSG